MLFLERKEFLLQSNKISAEIIVDTKTGAQRSEAPAIPNSLLWSDARQTGVLPVCNFIRM